jgi:hypothetical protein
MQSHENTRDSTNAEGLTLRCVLTGAAQALELTRFFTRESSAHRRPSVSSPDAIITARMLGDR